MLEFGLRESWEKSIVCNSEENVVCIYLVVDLSKHTAGSGQKMSLCQKIKKKIIVLVIRS